MDGTTLVQRWPCARVAMPDGSAGAIWRGIAYPLLPGDRIDVGVAAASTAATAHAVLPGEEATWILVQGLPAELDAARAALERAGVVISRTGRWLGEPVGGVGFDWFLRCAGRLDPTAVAALLGAVTPALVAADPAARALVLEQRVANLLAELAGLEQVLRKVTTPAAAPAQLGPAVPDAALRDALEQLAALQARLAELQATPIPRSPVSSRFRDELEAVMQAFRPDVVLLRDCLTVAIGEFSSRSGFYRAINELPVEGGRPGGWKMLQGAERWWERHVSTGRDDTGRAYARFDTRTRRWSLLLGWKAEQPRDIAWLRQQR